MTAAVPPVPDLAGPVGRRVAAGLSAPPTTYGVRDGVRDAVRTGHRWEITADGRIVGTRRGAVTGRDLTGDLVAAFARDHALGALLDDPFGGRLTDDPAVAREIADEVAAMVRREAATAARSSVLTLEQAVALRLATARRLWIDDDGALWWALTGVVDPVTGRGVPGQPAAERPGPPGLLDRLRRRPDGTHVTAAVVEAAVRDARLVQPHEPAPSWPAVIDALRVLAGGEPVAATADDDGPTGWLRRRTRTTH